MTCETAGADRVGTQDVRCTACQEGKGRRGRRPAGRDGRETGDEALLCGECGTPLGNRLSARGLDALIARVGEYNGGEAEGAALDALVDTYASVLKRSPKVDLLLMRNEGIVCRSEPDTQRGLVADLHECAWQEHESGAVKAIASRYRVVAAPQIRRGLEAIGYERSELGCHRRNVERAIWEYALQNANDEEAATQEERGVQVDLCVHWHDSGEGRARALIRSAWRAMQAERASAALHKAAARERNGTGMGSGRCSASEEGGRMIEASWVADTDEAERDAIVHASTVPARWAKRLKETFERHGAQEHEVRTMHQMWNAWVWARVTL